MAGTGELAKKAVGKIAKARMAFDLADLAMTAFSIGLTISFALGLSLDIIIKTTIGSGLQTKYQLMYAVLYSTHNGKPIYKYVEKALASNSEVVDGFNIPKYLNELDLSSVCWKLVKNDGKTVFGNCENYSFNVVVPFKNGTFEAWYK